MREILAHRHSFFDTVVITCALLLLYATSAGCSTVKGGQTRHATDATTSTGGTGESYRVSVAPNGAVSVERGEHVAPSTTANHELVATTQPDISSAAGLPKLTAQAGEGLLQGVSFDQAAQRKPVIFVGCLLLGVAAVLYYLKQYFPAIVAACLVPAAFFMPIVLAWGCAGLLLVYIVFTYRKYLHQLVEGGANVVAVAGDNAESVKKEFERAQDATLKSFINPIVKKLNP